KKECLAVGKYVHILLERDINPTDIMTRKAFEDAIRMIVSMGASTNAVLHSLAIGKPVGIDITPDDLQQMSDQTHVLADFKPSGKFLMQDLQQYGGTPAVMRFLLDEGLIHGDCLTVTGKTVAENLSDVKSIMDYNQPII